MLNSPPMLMMFASEKQQRTWSSVTAFAAWLSMDTNMLAHAKIIASRILMSAPSDGPNQMEQREYS
jgi:hypothetical protein